MANIAANVVVAGTGAVYRALEGATLPTSITDPVAEEFFAEHGYINQDGVAEAIDEQVTSITAWQNSDVVRKVMTSQDVMYTFAPIETNGTVLESYYGNYNAGTVQIKGEQGKRAAWVIDAIDGDDRHVRIVIPDGQVTSRGGVIRNAQAAMEYPITITCYPDSSGVKAYIYVDEAELDEGS